MNPGKLRDRGQILRLAEVGEKVYNWQSAGGIWCEFKETGEENLFSKVGIGAAGAEITVRENKLTCNDALLVRGEHFFITDINRTGIAPIYYKVQAAMIAPETATVTRTVVSIGSNGIPANTSQIVAECPVYLTEKALSTAEEKSMVESTNRLVAVTPKILECLPGDIMEFMGMKYRVNVCHIMERYKNEYEIERITDD